MAKKTVGAGFWHAAFPNQLGNFCFLIFWIGLALFILSAFFDLNVFDPDCFKSTDARIPDLGTRRVVDETGVLTSSEINMLTGRIDAFEAASGGQMAVLIIRSLHGDAVEDFSLATAEKWKLGHKGEDNGVLLLLALEDRRSRLEIGYGLEGVINDARAGDILRDMAPYMRKGEYANAIDFVIRSVEALVLHENGPEAPADEEVDEEYDMAPEIPNEPKDTLLSVLWLCVLFEIFGTLLAGRMIHPSVRKSIGLLAMILIGKFLWDAFILFLKGMTSSGGRGGGGGGSSRGGGGGGSFGGGGASGRW